MSGNLLYFRYLNGLELMQIPKPIREDLGGGTKEFTVKDVSAFAGVHALRMRV